MAQGALPGFRDFYPREFSERAYIMRAWREVARRYGFAEYDGPPLEPLELYTKKSGEEIVGQLYAFTDKGGREIALRPEMTPTVARMVGERASALRKPVRWFSTPQLFRYERQQKGRLREHYQLNVDIFGEAGVAADAELLACAIDVMREFRLTSRDVYARVSDRRLASNLVLRTSSITEAQLPVVFAVVDKIGRESDTVAAERLSRAGFDAGQIQSVDAIFRKRWTLDELRAAATEPVLLADYERLDKYFTYLRELGVDDDWFELDLTIVRGLAYYTGTVFELFDRRGEFRAICGGGRYDTLLKSLGGADLPALGFGMGDVVLGELLRARGLMPDASPAIDAWVAAADDTAVEDVLFVAAALRRQGHSVEYALRAQKIDKQQKAAQAAGARRLVVVPAEFRREHRVHVAPPHEKLIRPLDPARFVSLDDALAERPTPAGAT